VENGEFCIGTIIKGKDLRGHMPVLKI